MKIWLIVIVGIVVIALMISGKSLLSSIAIVGLIALIIVLIIVALIVLIIKKLPSDEEWKAQKWGKDYKTAIETGKLSVNRSYSCEPDSVYTSVNSVNRELYEITGHKDLLPKFDVTYCAETLRDFTGDYSGFATIEFEQPISNEIFDILEKFDKDKCDVLDDTNIDSVNAEQSKKGMTINLSTPYEKDNRDDLFWSIKIERNSNEGSISYGRV